LEETYIAAKNEVIQRVHASGLDLYCVNAEADPPVYKLLDYGRFRYDQQKKKREHQKKLREQNRAIKEFKFKPSIDDHDIDVKINHIRGNLADHDVKICMEFKRGNAFVLTNRWSRSIAEAVSDQKFVLNRVLNDLTDLIQPVNLTITENMVFAVLRRNEAISD
jgi:translation initiation factor IF-3